MEGQQKEIKKHRVCTNLSVDPDIAQSSRGLLTRRGKGGRKEGGYSAGTRLKRAQTKMPDHKQMNKRKETG